MTGDAGAPQRATTPCWMWIALAGLTILAFGAIALHARFYTSTMLAQLPAQHWGWWLRFELAWPMAILTLVAPALGAVALAMKRWRLAALGVVAFAAVMQIAALGLEYHWKAQECTGEFDRDMPWRLEGWEKQKDLRRC